MSTCNFWHTNTCLCALLWLYRHVYWQMSIKNARTHTHTHTHTCSCFSYEDVSISLFLSYETHVCIIYFPIAFTGENNFWHTRQRFWKIVCLDRRVCTQVLRFVLRERVTLAGANGLWYIFNVNCMSLHTKRRELGVGLDLELDLVLGSGLGL